MNKANKSRRDFLIKTGYFLAASGVVSLSGCSTLPVCYGKKHDIIIDSHTHIFNSRDFEQLTVLVYVAIAQVKKYTTPFGLNDFFDRLLTNPGVSTVNIIEKIFENLTPSYAEETKLLDNKLGNYQIENTLSHLIKTSVPLVKTNSFLSQDRDITEEEFYSIYEDKKIEVLKELSKNVSGNGTKKLTNDIDMIYQYVQNRIDNNLSNKANNNENNLWDEMIADEGFKEIEEAYNSGTPNKSGIVDITHKIEVVSKYIDYFIKVRNIVQFFISQTRTHYGNALTLNRRFENVNRFWGLYKDKAGADHYVTASVDMDFWVNALGGYKVSNKKNHTLLEQYALIEKTAILMKGKILPMVAFDPGREYEFNKNPIEGQKTPFELVKLAIKKHGFVGVKVYPPMGFMPYGNSDRTARNDWPKHLRGDEHWLKDSENESSIGENLDRILIKFFKFCIEEDVPVMAHASPTMYTDVRFEKFASADSWKKVLDYVDKDEPHVDFSKLRLNLGHSGGLNGLIEKGMSKWSKGIIGLVKNYDNVYMDFSNFDGIHTSSNQDDLIKVLRGLDRKVKKKIMYGSDWSMLEKYDRRGQYLGNMLKVVNNLNSKESSGFMGQNCLSFLGFDRASSKNVKRLLTFYNTHNIRIPKVFNL